MIARVLLSLAVLLLASPAGATTLPDARLVAELLTQAPDASSMPPKATGNVYEKAGHWYARLRLGPEQRLSIALPTCSTEAEALARLPILSDPAAKLRASGHLGHKIAWRDRDAADEVAVPLAAAVPDVAAPAAPTTSLRADMRRALAEGLTRGLAAGDDKAARIAIVALSGLMDDKAESAPDGAVAVVDPRTEGRRGEQ